MAINLLKYSNRPLDLNNDTAVVVKIPEYTYQKPTLDTWSKPGISNSKTWITRGPARLIRDVSAPEGKSD